MKEDKIIDVSSGICPVGPSRKVKAAIRKAIRQIKHSPDDALARLERLFLSKFGVAAERIMFANSVREVVYLTVSSLRPKRVLVAGPSISLYGVASASAGAEVLQFALDREAGFALDPDRLDAALEDVDLLFISNPNRITGRVISDEVSSRIAAAAGQGRFRVLIDESLIEFSASEGLGQHLSGMDNIIIVRTTANFYGLPGLELAYAVSSEPIVRGLKKKYLDLNTLSLEAARAALKDETYRKTARRFVDDEKKFFSQEIEKIADLAFIGSDSNVFLVELKHPEERVLSSLMNAGFFIKDCAGIEGLGRGFLRVSVMEHDKNVKLVRQLKALLQPPRHQPD